MAVLAPLGQMSVEVVIQGHADAILRGCRQQYVEILGPVQSNLYDVDRIEAALSEKSSGSRRSP